MHAVIFGECYYDGNDGMMMVVIKMTKVLMMMMVILASLKLAEFGPSSWSE